MSKTDQDEYEALLQFLYLAPIGLAQIRADGEIVMINPLCAQLLMPLSPDGGLSNLFDALAGVAPDLRHRTQAFSAPQGRICDAVHLHVEAGRSSHRETQVLSLSLIKLDAERCMAVLGDATHAVRRERELRQSQAWIHTIVGGMNDYALVRLDAQGRCLDWNASVERITGFGRAAVEGASCSLFSTADGREAVRIADRLKEADDSGWSLDEGWRQRADGSRYWGSCLIAPLHAPGRPQAPEQPPEPRQSPARGYHLIIRDISDRREATDALRRSVWSDHLTGLSNRRVLFEAGELEVRRWRQAPRPLSLVLIDADHFKQINDRYGHAAGDEVLRHLAAVLTATFGVHSTVARLGGEEFVALCPGLGETEAEAVAQRLCCAVEAQPVRVGEHSIRCTVSAGVAAVDARIGSFDDLLQRADAAMYAAKAAGRDRVVRWEPGLKASARPDGRPRA
jgi:diguanylate cyclase (GGDEF)-like protein/PAS domain S-box-containing protein